MIPFQTIGDDGMYTDSARRLHFASDSGLDLSSLHRKVFPNGPLRFKLLWSNKVRTAKPGVATAKYPLGVMKPLDALTIAPHSSPKITVPKDGRKK